MGWKRTTVAGAAAGLHNVANEPEEKPSFGGKGERGGCPTDTPKVYRIHVKANNSNAAVNKYINDEQHLVTK